MISDHDPDDLHLHVATRADSVSQLLIGEALLGLATLVCDLGPDPDGRVLGRQVLQRLRRHLPQPVAPLLLRPLLLAGQRRRLPRAAEGLLRCLTSTPSPPGCAPPAASSPRRRRRCCVAAASGPDLEALVARRVAGEPLEHLLGWVSFAGLRVVVGPGVFVPRRRSELLVRLAVSIVRRRMRLPGAARRRIGRRTIDPGGRPVLRVGGDRGGGGSASARTPRCGRPTSTRSRWRTRGGTCRPTGWCEGDLYDALPDRLRGSVDVLVVNAPYVPTDAIATMPPEARDHEPRVALDGGGDGVDLHRRVAAGAADVAAARRSPAGRDRPVAGRADRRRLRGGRPGGVRRDRRRPGRDRGRGVPCNAGLATVPTRSRPGG